MKRGTHASAQTRVIDLHLLPKAPDQGQCMADATDICIQQDCNMILTYTDTVAHIRVCILQFLTSSGDQTPNAHLCSCPRCFTPAITHIYTPCKVCPRGLNMLFATQVVQIWKKARALTHNANQLRPPKAVLSAFPCKHSSCPEDASNNIQGKVAH